MKPFYVTPVITSVLQFLFPVILFAQFHGGTGSGSVVAKPAVLSLGKNIFTGGNDDGTSAFAKLAAGLGQNIFIGGSDDGFSAANAANSGLGKNIFTGGSDDGTAVFATANATLGNNIFTGGSDDGQAATTKPGVPLGTNIFTGGQDDGWAMAIADQLVLPVSLLNFSGQWLQNDALLSWQTSQEINTARFEVQRSFDGSRFTTVQTVAAAGQSSSTRNYSSKDINIKFNLNSGSTVFYRLCTVDINGQKTYSAVVLLTADGASQIIYTLFPNPARDNVNISRSGNLPNGDTYLILTDANGKTVLRRKMTGSSEQISVSSFAGGTYFLQIINQNKRLYSQKLIILK